MIPAAMYAAQFIMKSFVAAAVSEIPVVVFVPVVVNDMFGSVIFFMGMFVRLPLQYGHASIMAAISSMAAAAMSIFGEMPGLPVFFFVLFIFNKLQ